jgi:hypothetical protein
VWRVTAVPRAFLEGLYRIAVAEAHPVHALFHHAFCQAELGAERGVARAVGLGEQ